MEAHDLGLPSWSIQDPRNYDRMVKVLGFSDLHCDLVQAATLVKRSEDADLVAGVGDFATVHRGLERTIDALKEISCPTLLVCGNNETEDELRDATADWESAQVIHGTSVEIDGIEFFGLGGGIPTTPWDWSFDLDEDEARKALAACPRAGVMLVHSPPYGHADVSSAAGHLGSRAILETVERCEPRLVLCGHIHESWGVEARIGASRVLNLGPQGQVLEDLS